MRRLRHLRQNETNTMLKLNRVMQRRRRNRRRRERSAKKKVGQEYNKPKRSRLLPKFKKMLTRGVRRGKDRRLRESTKSS